MLEDCQPKAILLGKAELPVETNIPVIDLFDSEVYTGEIENPEHVNTPNDLIYIIYTSGTTGKPKGVMNVHTGTINRIVWMQNRYPLDEKDVILQKTTYTFDVSIWEILWWSFVGAKVIMLKPGAEKEPLSICNVIEKHQVSTMHFVPSMLSVFLQWVKEKNEANKLKSLRYVFASGEALQINMLKNFNIYIRSKNDITRLINFYGPTEASIDVTYFDCEYNYDLLPIGKPIANTQIYIIGDNNLCGIGMPGELCIAGVGLARGYLNLPELTAEKFVKNPFGKGRMYRSGDLARWLPDGNIEFLGRIDEQVKIRGYRIELGEIESVLRKIDYIKDAAVIAMKDTSGDKAVYAYLSSDEVLDISIIRSKLMKHLPQYMLPAYIRQIDSIPVTSNGKIDERRLSTVKIIDIKEYIEPKNDKEAVICKVYKDILHLDKVSTTDTFFELGGDSIKAIRVVSKLREYGYNARAREILNNTSITELSGYIHEITEPVCEQDEINPEVKNTHHMCYSDELKLAKANDSVRIEYKKELPVVLQEEVKVYLHRSLPLCIFLAYENYAGWYYSNYIQIFSQENEYGLTELEYMEPRDSYADISDVICLGYHMFRDNEDFIDFVKNKLSLGYYIIANVDEMELSNKYAYQRDHFIHASLIYGYDDNKRALKGIGFDDSHIFSYLEFGYDEMQRAFTSGKKYYKMSAPYCEWSTVYLIKPKSLYKKFIFDKRKFLRDFHDYVYSVEDTYRLYAFTNREDKNEYGINTYDVVIERLKEREKTGSPTIDYRAIHLIYEHRQGLYNRIRYLDDMCRLSEEVKNENQKLHELVEEINKIRIKWFQVEYNPESDIAMVNTVIKELIGDISNLKIKEIKIITRLYELLKKQFDNEKWW
jgi:amino acid adenylation domain-containing protein